MNPRTISCCFQANGAKPQSGAYTYLVPPGLDPKIGDIAVVQVRGRYECVLVVALNPKLDPNAKFEYKHILDLVEIHRPELPG